MHIYPINGAVQRVGGHDTAFRFPDASFAEVIVGIDGEKIRMASGLEFVRCGFAAGPASVSRRSWEVVAGSAGFTPWTR
jgi:hypothetical protein